MIVSDSISYSALKAFICYSVPGTPASRKYAQIKEERITWRVRDKRKQIFFSAILFVVRSVRWRVPVIGLNVCCMERVCVCVHTSPNAHVPAGVALSLPDLPQKVRAPSHAFSFMAGPASTRLSTVWRGRPRVSLR